jgi:hypothetical protein
MYPVSIYNYNNGGAVGYSLTKIKKRSRVRSPAAWATFLKNKTDSEFFIGM